MRTFIRKVKLYLSIFWFSILLATVAACFWFFVPDSIGNLKITLLGTVLGFGLTMSVTRNFDSLVQHKRRKRTLGMIKLVAVPYLKNRAENLQAFVDGSRDLCSTEEAVAFVRLVSNFDTLASSVDREWVQLIYSQEFLDALNSDDHFNAIADAVVEVALYIDQLSAQSITAKALLPGDRNLTSDDQVVLIRHARDVRNNLEDTTRKLTKHVDNLDREISQFLSRNGVRYEERDR